MFKSIAALVALFAGTSAIAQIGPEIAYAKESGSGFDIYLVNSNGSGLVQLYRGAAKKGISHLDIKPGGGEIAFMEGTVLKTLRYDNNGVALGPPTIIESTCMAGTMDYSPDGTSLLYAASCAGSGQIKRFPGSSTPLVVTGILSSVRWTRDGSSFIYNTSTASAPGVHFYHKRTLTGSTDVILFQTNYGGWIDVGRVGDTILHTNGQSYTSEYSTIDGSLIGQANFITGTDGHYSPTDDRILYRSPHVASGVYLMIRQNSGAVSRLTGKGGYSGKDWRPALPAN